MKTVPLNPSRLDAHHIEHLAKGFRGGCSTGAGRTRHRNNRMFG
ncbi:Uncharacterised protein [Vibrio cholerae]|uniref:Uncharacterized protein n=1 Tax=Vibrio cholerae TaxID=666 RepID=A0A655VLE8_VIBCL|nr:Uncharacterised protein [Vibrio cholerae]CSB91505.1 Uncharacterised protein [Vibrio cholerae]